MTGVHRFCTKPTQGLLDLIEGGLHRFRAEGGCEVVIKDGVRGIDGASLHRYFGHRQQSVGVWPWVNLWLPDLQATGNLKGYPLMLFFSTDLNTSLPRPARCTFKFKVTSSTKAIGG